MTSVHDYPYTAGDSRGSLIDWSGVTGVAVCYVCGWSGGPAFSISETMNIATVHHNAAHPENTPLTEKAEAASKPGPGCTTPDCPNKHKAKGLCSGCIDRTKFAWIQELGEAGLDETYEEYKARTRVVPTSGRWAGHTVAVKRKRVKEKAPCSMPGCERPYSALGLCVNHYAAERRRSNRVEKTERVKRSCTVPECEKQELAKGLCRPHYNQAWYYDRKAKGAA